LPDAGRLFTKIPATGHHTALEKAFEIYTQEQHESAAMCTPSFHLETGKFGGTQRGSVWRTG